MRPENDSSGQKKPSFIEQARRAQIVASAVEVIADVGFGNASLAAIARHAGISKGVISYHFAGKDELMEKLVEEVFGQVFEFVGARMVGQDTAVGLLRTQVLTATEYMRGHRSQVMALGEIVRNLRKSDGTPRYGIDTNDGLYEALEHIYRFGQETGEFRTFDVRAMAISHQAAVDTMFGYWAVHPDHDLEAHAHELLELLLRGTRADPVGGTTS